MVDPILLIDDIITKPKPSFSVRWTVTSYVGSGCGFITTKGVCDGGGIAEAAANVELINCCWCGGGKCSCGQFGVEYGFGNWDGG